MNVPWLPSTKQYYRWLCDFETQYTLHKIESNLFFNLFYKLADHPIHMLLKFLQNLIQFILEILFICNIFYQKQTQLYAIKSFLPNMLFDECLTQLLKTQIHIIISFDFFTAWTSKILLIKTKFSLFVLPIFYFLFVYLSCTCHAICAS